MNAGAGAMNAGAGRASALPVRLAGQGAGGATHLCRFVLGRGDADELVAGDPRLDLHEVDVVLGDHHAARDLRGQQAVMMMGHIAWTSPRSACPPRSETHEPGAGVDDHGLLVLQLRYVEGHADHDVVLGLLLLLLRGLILLLLLLLRGRGVRGGAAIARRGLPAAARQLLPQVRHVLGENLLPDLEGFYARQRCCQGRVRVLQLQAQLCRAGLHAAGCRTMGGGGATVPALLCVARSSFGCGPFAVRCVGCANGEMEKWFQHICSLSIELDSAPRFRAGIRPTQPGSCIPIATSTRTWSSSRAQPTPPPSPATLPH
jgi:hypothetical protein